MESMEILNNKHCLISNTIKMKKWTINSAYVLLDDFLKYINGFEDKYRGVSKWYEQTNGNKELKYFSKASSRSSVYDARKYYREKSEEKSNEEETLNHEKFGREYLSDIKTVFDRYKNYRETENPDRLRFYNIYFLQVKGNLEEPRLGKVILEIRELKKIKIKNFEAGRNFKGEASIESGIFNMKLKLENYSVNDSIRNVTLSFMLNSIHFDQEIILGTYISYENKELRSGTVVLTKTDEFGEPCIVNIEGKQNLNSKEDLANTQSEAEIIGEYLGIKQSNYLRIPNKPKSLNELKERILTLKNRRLRPSVNRFVQRSVKLVHLAAPFSSTNESQQKSTFKLLKRLGNDLKDYCQVYIPLVETVEGYIESQNPDVTLKSLQNTEIFVLILTKTSLSSFSLIELGYAIAHCKKVFLFYENKSVSEQILALNSSHLITCYLLPNKKPESVIFNRIKGAIEEFN